MKLVTVLRQLAAAALLLFAFTAVLHAQQTQAPAVEQASIDKLDPQFEQIEVAVAEFGSCRTAKSGAT